MTVKEWLGQYRAIMREIDIRTEEVERLRAKASKVTQTITGMPRGAGGADWTALVDAIVDITRDMDARTEQLRGTAAQILDAINAVADSGMRQCLTLRYVCGWPYLKIARKMGYSEDGLYKLHRRALRCVIMPDGQDGAVDR